MSSRRAIYLDNASTSHPKPDVVWKAARAYLDEIGASPGRAGHRGARDADAAIEKARAAVARLLGVRAAWKVAFTGNATHALNIAIKGVLSPGDHVVTTAAEHNSVLRPLESLRRAGQITYTIVRPSADGCLRPGQVAEAMRSNTRLVVVNHASNVTGAVSPVEDLVPHAHERGALFLLDASQTAGFLDLEAERLEVDLLAFTGHKALRGPSGTGGLYVRDPDTVRPLHEGGTGLNSQSLRQPAAMPAKLEAGTLNYLGVAGLGAAVELLLAEGIDRVRERELALTRRCLDRIGAIDGVVVHGVAPDLPRVPVISLGVEGLYTSEVSAMLDEDFGIMTRAGLHCAPLIHQVLGTSPHGTVRVSIGAGNSEDEIDRLGDALEAIRARVPSARP